MIDASNYKFLKALEHNVCYGKHKFGMTCEFMNSTSGSFPNLCEMLYEKLGVVATVGARKDDIFYNLQFLTYDSDGQFTKDVLFFNENIDRQPFSFIMVTWWEYKTEDEIADQFIQRISSRTMFEWDWLGKNSMGKRLFTLPSANSVVEMKMKIQLIGDTP